MKHNQRTPAHRSTRKTMIVALARKLLIALWRLVTTGEVPEGVVLVCSWLHPAVRAAAGDGCFLATSQPSKPRCQLWSSSSASRPATDLSPSRVHSSFKHPAIGIPPERRQSRSPKGRLNRSQARTMWAASQLTGPELVGALGMPAGRPACPHGTFLLIASCQRMRQNPYDWPHVGGFVVVWLVIAAVAGMGLVALFDPGSIDVLVTAEL
jgi:hypothetical protein